MRLYLVRHGQTASNVARLLDTAAPGADLDAEGRAQAERLVERLHGVRLDALYASDLVRTQQTAAPLARARGLEVAVLGGLREIQAGAEEMSSDWSAYIDVLRRWATGEPDAANPGGEDAHAFFGRFDAAIAHVVGAGHRSAAVVSHGAAIRTWVSHRAGNTTPSEVAALDLHNTAIVVLDGNPDGWRLRAWHQGPGDVPDPGDPDES